MTSRYAELVAPREMALKEEQIDCTQDEMLVRITHCGLCRYDGSYFKGIIGSIPQRLGHEPVGIVEQVGKNVTGFKPGDRVKDLTRGRGIDVAVEVVGLPGPAELAARALRKGGRPRYVLAGWHGQPGTFVLRNWTTVGAEILCAHPSYSLDPVDDLRRGVDALGRGVFPMDRLVTHRYPLERVQEGLEAMVGKTPGYIKGVIEMP